MLYIGINPDEYKQDDIFQRYKLMTKEEDYRSEGPDDNIFNVY